MTENKRIIIIGATNFAKLIRYYIENDAHWKVCAFSVENSYIKSEKYDGLPLVSFESLLSNYSPSEYEVVLGIGYSQMNEVRKKFYVKCKQMGYRIPNYIHSSAHLSLDTIFAGEGNIILESAITQPFVKIGAANLMWDRVTISHDSIIGDYNTIAGNTHLAGFVNVKNNCFLGSSCTIRDKINVQEYTLVGSCANVAKNTQPYDVIMPARSVVLEKKRSTDMI